MTFSANTDVSPPFSPSALRAVQAISADAEHGVTVICGFPAAGKTTATRVLAGLVDAVVLDKDTFAPQLEESVMTRLTGHPYDRDSEIYRQVVAPHIYSALVQNAVRIARQVPVLVDAPFLGYITAAGEQNLRLSDYIRTIAGGDTVIRTVWVDTDPARIRERMTLRGAERDRPKLADWQTYRTSILDSGLAHTGPRVADYLVTN
ncbi:AAA family ATPase [Nocardia cyriacigeorgica]|uniref:AAA family ATPase n=1 Tax=Nocardia cyriacigeorgica TaxID=135487 RepID=UPI0018943628|nr:AAA family ATPase [Nocardia cyriacigeorgica]MBF6102183.1 AAA family ATPase [Nocardia cyriacigeorgica]